MKNIETSDKPNAFAFKAKIDDEVKLCICPRIDNQWSEPDIFTIPQEIPSLSEKLDENKFKIIFINLVPSEDESFNISIANGGFLSSDYSSQELYENKLFFQYVEDGYNKLYPNEN